MKNIIARLHESGIKVTAGQIKRSDLNEALIVLSESEFTEERMKKLKDWTEQYVYDFLKEISSDKLDSRLKDLSTEQYESVTLDVISAFLRDYEVKYKVSGSKASKLKKAADFFVDYFGTGFMVGDVTDMKVIKSYLNGTLLDKEDYSLFDEVAREGSYEFEIIDNKLLQSSEKHQLALVERSGALLEHIKKPSMRVILEAIKNNPYAARYVKNPSEELQLHIVKYGGSEYIKNPSKNVIREMYKNDIRNIIEDWGYKVKYRIPIDNDIKKEMISLLESGKANMGSRPKKDTYEATIKLLKSNKTEMEYNQGKEIIDFITKSR